MSTNDAQITGEHRTMLLIEVMHAAIVSLVILCSTSLVILEPARVTSDLLSFVFGGAISYAGGRAAASRQAFTRRQDHRSADNDDADAAA